MKLNISSSITLDGTTRKALANIPGTRLEVDKQMRLKLFLEKCEKLGISEVNIQEEVRLTRIAIGFYALVLEQEYGISQTFEFDNRTETILDVMPKVIEATKVWNKTIVDLIQDIAKMKGLV